MADGTGGDDRFLLAARPADTTLVDRAILVASELVTNAVVHARTDLRLRLELRGDWLHIAVRDGSPRLLRLVTARDPEAEGGRGLWLVDQLGRAWGSTPTPMAAWSSGASSSCKPVNPDPGCPTDPRGRPSAMLRGCAPSWSRWHP
jgi:hypothetical protein